MENARTQLANHIDDPDIQAAVLDGAVGNPHYCGPHSIAFQLFCEGKDLPPDIRDEMSALKRTEELLSIGLCIEQTAKGILRADYLREIMQANEDKLPDFLYKIIKDELVAAVSDIDNYSPTNHRGSQRDFSDRFSAQMTFLKILEQNEYDTRFVDEKRALTLQKRKIKLGY